MFRTFLIFIVFFETFCNLYSQITIINESLPNEKKGISVNEFNYKTLISVGLGYSLTFNSKVKNNFLFSIDLIPKISKQLFVDIKIDAIKQGESYLALLNVIPEYKINLTSYGKFQDILELV